MDSNREPTIKEEKLLSVLVKRSSIAIPENWRDGLLVRSMDDGKMGSLLLFPQNTLNEDRVFGEQVSDFQFIDLDGVQVIASLYLDNRGNLFELDIWKTNFEELLEFPDL
jgi:hypothetical protein